jgi:thiol-disulfide isomerase/thioredoxin
MASMPEVPTGAVTTQVTVVESEACHFCDDAHRVLEGLASAYPLSVRAIDVRGDEGGQLMRRHRAAMSPLVLVDGVFFSQGRLPRRKLTKLLTQRYGASSIQAMSSSAGGGRHG